MNWIMLGLFIIVLMPGKLLVSSNALSPKKSPTKKSSAKEDQSSEIPYQLRSPLFTPAERVFYTALSEAISNNQLVFGKVRVADVLQPAAGLSKSRWQIAFNRISAKHFDYVICDKDTLSIHAAIELQDKSHHQPNRFKRDQFLKAACKSANLQLLEFWVKPGYIVEDVRSALVKPNRLP